MESEREVMVLLESALNAAEAAAKNGGASKSRCIELLKSLKYFPITVDVLLSTQIAKRLRHLKTHQREKIRLMAAWLMEVWSKKIKDDRSSSRNYKGGKGISTPDSLMISSWAANKRKLEPRRECPDASRNKVREILMEAFSRVAGEIYKSEEVKERVRGFDPVGVAVAVESVMFKNLGPYNGAKKLKYRSIMFNVKDPKNPDLRRNILVGDIKPEMLITMTSEEMASYHRQCLNYQIKRKTLACLIKKSDEDEAIS